METKITVSKAVRECDQHTRPRMTVSESPPQEQPHGQRTAHADEHRDSAGDEDRFPEEQVGNDLQIYGKAEVEERGVLEIGGQEDAVVAVETVAD